MVEKEIRFVVDGRDVGGSFITVEDGKVQTSAAEDEFYAVLRKNENEWLKEAEEQEKSDLVDRLTPKGEEKLKEAHMAQYHGTDDDSVDDYELWLENLTASELKEILV